MLRGPIEPHPTGRTEISRVFSSDLTSYFVHCPSDEDAQAMVDIEEVRSWRDARNTGPVADRARAQP